MSPPPSRAYWRRLAALFDSAVKLDDAGREAFLAQECGDEPGLRAELAAMLAADAAPAMLDNGASSLLGAARPTEDADCGRRLGPYRIVGTLGRGGMGVVYRATREDGAFAQQVAIKQLHANWTDGAHAERFLQERRMLAGLSHPHIARLLDGGLDQAGRPWFAMELVEGAPLTEWCDERCLGLRARLEMFCTVCEAVQHAHAHFIVHRDLKPGNILVDDDGHPHVLDFGVAKMLDADSAADQTKAAFTPEYAAPEQVTGGPITTATDVYALGVILYQLLSGRLPYVVAQDLHAATGAIVDAIAPPLAQTIVHGSQAEVSLRLQQRSTDLAGFRRFVGGDLGRIVQTALAKEPARRYASVEALALDLRRFLQGRTVSVVGDTFTYRAVRFVGRNRWAVAMATLAAVLLVAGLGGVLWQAQRAQAEAARATREAQRAEAQAERAGLEVRRVNAVNEFLGNVFSAADPMSSGGDSKHISLRDALDLAVRNAEGRIVDEPDLAIRVLLAASHSYDAMGEDASALALARRALEIQQSRLPEATEERAATLAQLAYLRGNYEPAQALQWATESMALRRANPDTTSVQMRDSIQTLLYAHYANEDYAGALAMNSELQAQLRADAAPESDLEWIAAQSDRAILLGLLGRDEEAVSFHEEAIRLRALSGGESHAAVALERLYYAVTLNRVGLHAQALHQLDQALPIVRQATSPDGDEVPRIHGEQGIALLGLDRAADAVRGLQVAHAHGRNHGFGNRQGRYGHAYAQALARLGRCVQAGRIVAELAQRGVDFRIEGRHPFDGSGCPP